MSDTLERAIQELQNAILTINGPQYRANCTAALEIIQHHIASQKDTISALIAECDKRIERLEEIERTCKSALERLAEIEKQAAAPQIDVPYLPETYSHPDSCLCDECFRKATGE